MTFNQKNLLVALAIVPVLVSCNSDQIWRWKGDTLFDNEGVAVGSVSSVCSDGISSNYSIDRLGEDTFKIEWVFTADEDISDVELAVDFEHSFPADYWMIPSVSYNGNNWGKGLEPKGASEDGKWRTYSYRRTPVPGAVYSEGARFAVATWSDVPVDQKEDFSCSVMPESDKVTHRLLWPEQELPVTYTKRDAFDAGWQRKVSMKKGEKKTMVMYLTVSDLMPEHRAMGKFLKNCWNNMPHPTFEGPSAAKVWEYGTGYYKQTLWTEEGIYRGFIMGLSPSGENEWVRAYTMEAGWCGQNIGASCSLLWDYIKYGNQESLDKGMATLDCWADNCRLPNGLFIVHFGDVLNKQESNLDACNLGTAALNYFYAYDLAKQCGYERPNYKQLALDICNFAISRQDEDGCYARGWKYDGSCIFKEGTVGCFLLPAMLEAYNQTSAHRYLESSVKAYQHYRKQLFEDGYTTAGALDTWCIDKESAITLLRSSLGLYGLTKEQRYLDDAVQTSYYLSTWLWHYDEVYPEDDQFTKFGYHTFGGTSVSAQHHHLDYYAALWIPEWIQLYELTADEQWLEKAQAIWANATQLISDGTFEINGRVRPFGSQNEAYFESSWGFYNKVDGDDTAPSVSRPDRINDWLVAWPSAFRMETYRKLDQSDKLSYLKQH